MPLHLQSSCGFDTQLTNMVWSVNGILFHILHIYFQIFWIICSEISGYLSLQWTVFLLSFFLQNAVEMLFCWAHWPKLEPMCVLQFCIKFCAEISGAGAISSFMRSTGNCLYCSLAHIHALSAGSTAWQWKKTKTKTKSKTKTKMTAWHQVEQYKIWINA